MNSLQMFEPVMDIKEEGLRLLEASLQDAYDRCEELNETKIQADIESALFEDAFNKFKESKFPDLGVEPPFIINSTIKEELRFIRTRLNVSRENIITVYKMIGMDVEDAVNTFIRYIKYRGWTEDSISVADLLKVFGRQS